MMQETIILRMPAVAVDAADLYALKNALQQENRILSINRDASASENKRKFVFFA